MTMKERVASYSKLIARETEERQQKLGPQENKQNEIFLSLGEYLSQ